MSNRTGLFCISVDTQATEPNSLAVTHHRQDVVALLDKYDVPSNWDQQIPTDASHAVELTPTLGKQLTRSEVVFELRELNARLAAGGGTVESCVLDPHEARAHWDVLVRQGCRVVRPRTATASSENNARVIRGGLWIAPLSCSFVGGSRRSVRSLFNVCQMKLIDAARRGQLFHVNIDIANTRRSWKEELEALRALLETGTRLAKRSTLRFAKLSEVPKLLSRKSASPQRSVLRRAA